MAEGRPSSVPPGLQLPNRPPSPFLTGRNIKEETAKMMADLKKENFSLKLKIYYLETTLSKVSGVEHFDPLQENVALKVEKENLEKELATNKELLVKASSVVDTLSSRQHNDNETKLQQEKEELRKMVTNLENELLAARQDGEEKALELEQLHADCMLLEDQIHLKDEAFRDQQETGDQGHHGNANEEIESLQAKLAAQEHLYQTDTEELREELEELREAMIRTHEENIEHRVRLAEKEQLIQELQERSGDESDTGESRASLLEALSSYTSNNARLEEELTSMEGANTELQNVINTLTNEREELLDGLAEKEQLRQQLRGGELELEQLRQEIHELKQSGTPVADLSGELESVREECEQLKHSLTQLKISNDISQNEAALLRGSIEESQQQKEEEEHQVKGLKQSMEKLSRENDEIGRENGALQMENESLRDRVHDLNRELCELKEENKHLSRASESESEGKINELTGEIASLKQNLNDANEKLKLRKEDGRALQVELESVSEELERSEGRLRESEGRRVAATDELDELREELLKIKNQGSDDQLRRSGELRRREEEVAKLRETIAGHEAKIAGLEATVGGLESAGEKRERLLKQASLDKGKAQFEAKKVASDVEAMRKEATALNAEKSNLANTNANLVKRTSDLESANKNLKDKTSNLESENKNLKDRTFELEAANKKLRDRAGKLEGEARRERERVGRLEDENQELRERVEELDQIQEEEDALSARKSYMEDRIKELEATKCSLEDSVLSLKDRLSETPIYENVIYETLDGEEDGEDALKDRIISELRGERDHHRRGKSELEGALRRMHEMIHDLIRQLHQYQPGGTLKSPGDDFLIDSLRDAIEIVLHTARDRQFSTTSSIQTSSGVVSDMDKPTEDLASLQRENALLHTDLLESRELIAALRKEMKELLNKLNSANSEDKHVRDMLRQINDLVSSSVLGGAGYPPSNDTTPEKGNHAELSSEHRLTEQRLKMRDARLAEIEIKLKQTVQELSSTECRLTATQSKLAVAEHRIQGYEQKERQDRHHRTSSTPDHHLHSSLTSKKIESLQTQLENTEQLLKEKMRLIRDKNEVIDSLLDEKRGRSRADDSLHSSRLDTTTGSGGGTRHASPGSLSPGALDLTPTTIQVSDYILLCPNNWLDELPELMRALRDALHSSLVDCQSVQTRVNERKAAWAMSEVSRLSTRLDAVYRLLQHVENLSIQQPPSRLLHSLQQEVKSKEQELMSVNEKLTRRSRDVARLRSKLEEQDHRTRTAAVGGGGIHTKKTSGLGGLNPTILSKVIDTETVLREAHKSLERRMLSKEGKIL